MQFIHRSTPILIAVAAAVATGSSAAQMPHLPIWAAIQEYGFAGSWSADCSQPASAKHPPARYFRGNGPASFKIDTGNAASDVEGQIVGLERLGPASARVFRRRPDGTSVSDDVELVDGKLRIVNGPRSELPLLQRCGD